MGEGIDVKPGFAAAVPGKLRAAAHARQAALLALDLAALERLLDDTLRYTHSKASARTNRPT